MGWAGVGRRGAFMGGLSKWFHWNVGLSLIKILIMGFFFYFERKRRDSV